MHCVLVCSCLELHQVCTPRKDPHKSLISSGSTLVLGQLSTSTKDSQAQFTQTRHAEYNQAEARSKSSNGSHDFHTGQPLMSRNSTRKRYVVERLLASVIRYYSGKLVVDTSQRGIGTISIRKFSLGINQTRNMYRMEHFIDQYHHIIQADFLPSCNCYMIHQSDRTNERENTTS